MIPLQTVCSADDLSHFFLIKVGGSGSALDIFIFGQDLHDI